MLCGTPGVSLNLSTVELLIVGSVILLALILRRFLKRRNEKGIGPKEDLNQSARDAFNNDENIDA